MCSHFGNSFIVNNIPLNFSLIVDRNSFYFNSFKNSIVEKIPLTVTHQEICNDSKCWAKGGDKGGDMGWDHETVVHSW